MHARRDAKGFDRETVILVDPGVRRLFDLLKMQDVVRVVESLDDAVRKRRSPPVVHFAFRGEVRPSRTLARSECSADFTRDESFSFDLNRSTYGSVLSLD